MGLSSQLQQTLVKDTNIRPPVTIADSATVRDAVEVMRSAGLGCVVVIDADEKAVGMFTEGILRHGLNDASTLLDDNIQTHMVERLPWVSPTESMSVVLEAMEDNNIRFLAILDEDHRVIGITGQKEGA
jgi:CBS domain-containing protein